MSTQTSVPSKTFLLGEYGALVGGPALLINTAPRFVLNVSEEKADASAFHPDSPAGRLFAIHGTIRNHFFDFRDPHGGKGGFGASSAQFALLYSQFLKKYSNAWTPEDYSSLIQIYRELASPERSTQPSGYDVAAQMLGGVSHVCLTQNKFDTFRWRFEEMGFFLLRTGFKVPTHDHLKNLTDNNFHLFADISGQGVHSFQNGDSELFIRALKEFRDAQKGMNLVTRNTLSILDELAQVSEVECAKGCGALGADVIFVLFRKENQNNLRQKLSERWEVIASQENLAHGLESNEI